MEVIIAISIIVATILASLLKWFSNVQQYFGGVSRQELFFVPNADSEPKKGHEISEPVLFRYLLNDQTLELLNEGRAEIPEKLGVLRVIEKESEITEFETHKSKMVSITNSKVFHVFIVFKTTSKKDKNVHYWWSLEKNRDYIDFQRSPTKNDVKNKWNDEEREGVELIVEGLEGKGTIKDLLAILWAHKVIPEKYHLWKSNCQSFVTFVSKRITVKEYEYKGVFQCSPLPETDRNAKMLDLLNVLTGITDWHPLFSLIYLEKIDLFDRVTKSGDYDINASQRGITPLNVAILFSKTKMVRHLLDETKADPTVRDQQGRDALQMAAVFANETEIIDLLLAHDKVKIEDIDQNGRAALHVAAYASNVVTVKYLIDKGANPHIFDNHGVSPLHLAAGEGTGKEIIDLILQAKKMKQNHEGIDDVDGGSDFGGTALHYAAMGSNEITAQYLIEKGANLHYRDKDGRSPLHIAAFFAKDMKIIDLLLRNIKEEDFPQYKNDKFILVSENENGLGDKIIDRLRQKGIKVLKIVGVKKEDNVDGLANRLKEKPINRTEKPQVEFSKDDSEEDIVQNEDWLRSDKLEDLVTVTLSQIIIDSDVKKLSNLIEKETDISTAKWENGMNALHAASKYAKTTKLIDVVLQTGKFNIDGGDNVGSTPLHYAIAGTNPEENARHLILMEANPTIADKNGITPLHRAAFYSKNTKTIELLLNTNKVDINACDNDGQTALHYALKNANPFNIIQFLVEKGANPKLRQNAGISPFHVAAAYTKDSRVLDLLLENGSSIDERNDSELTALHMAMRESNATTASHLLLNGADPNVADANGYTPLHAAVTFAKDIDILELLLKHKDVDVNRFDKHGRSALDYAKGNVYRIGETIANRLKNSLPDEYTRELVQIEESSKDDEKFDLKNRNIDLHM